MPPLYDYVEAYSRNIGWVTEAEQAQLRNSTVAIAGLGGVGGSHLLALCRLGVGRFHVADLDTFDVVNINRQAGAMVSTFGQPKTDVLARMARDINPDVQIETFSKGVDSGNLPEFLDGVDLYVDGLDFFAFDARRLTFGACGNQRVPAITAAPLGFGAAFLYFAPGGMSFEEYFRLEGCSEYEMSLRFLLGLSPAMLQRGYLADPSRVDLEAHRGPSTIAACLLCSGLVATESAKILLGRGGLKPAPHGYQFDAYRNRFVRTWRPMGNRNPLQRLALSVAKAQLARMKRA